MTDKFNEGETSQGVDILWGVLVGVDISGSNQNGLSVRLDTVTIEWLEGIFMVSGLSLALLSVLPLGGLTPRLGRVVIFSMLGLVYGPKIVSSTWVYSLSPKVLCWLPPYKTKCSQPNEIFTPYICWAELWSDLTHNTSGCHSCLATPMCAGCRPTIFEQEWCRSYMKLV